MATREKKLSINSRKQNTTQPNKDKDPTNVKNEATTPDANKPATKQNTTAKNTPAKSTSLAKKLARKLPAKTINKKPSVAIKLKAKAKKPIKLNQKLAKSLLQNAKETKKKLIKNGIKEIKPRKKRASPLKKDGPPVLEPIFPLEENVEKKQPKKRVGKKPAPKSNSEADKKIENDDSISIASDITDSSNTDIIPKQANKKPRVLKKTKTEPESLEDVMTELSYIIKSEDIKNEVDTISESSKSDSVKPKKLTKKQRLDLERKMIKKENIENTTDHVDQKIIDRLDLNVNKIKKVSPLKRRRHSIEKYPLGVSDPTMPQLSVFNHLPRSISPRSKRGAKVRQSVDGVSRRSSPYTTRSDSPARILRNGKHRKLKDISLLDGLESDLKKRKRLCSDLSGSELSVSKFSGYESDSSYSDLASLHGADNTDSTNDLKSSVNLVENDTLLTTHESVLPGTIKRTPSSEETAVKPITGENKLTDTNSNLYTSNPVDINLNDKKLKTDNIKMEVDDEPIAVNPSLKVPEKSMILNIMKQAFNEVPCDEKKNTTDPLTEPTPVMVSKFYGKSNENNTIEEISATVDELIAEMNEQVGETVRELPLDEFSDTIPAMETKNIEQLTNCEAMLPENVNSSSEISDIQDNSNPNELSKPQLEVVGGDEPAPLPLEIEEEDPKQVENQGSQTDTVEEGEELLMEDDNPPVLQPEIIDQNTVEETTKENKIIPEQPQPILEPCQEIPKEHEDKPQLQQNGVATLEEPNCDAPLLPIEDPTVEPVPKKVIESPEDLEKKENILQALGLQSLRAAEEAAAKQKQVKDKPASDTYTGTLKTVIKINRDKKKGRNPLKMTLQKSKGKVGDAENAGCEEGYKIMKDGMSATWKHSGQSSDTAGAQRKSHYSNRSNMDGSSEHTSDGETTAQEGPQKALVIPEKASSFSIHPGRLCKDECSYCFGKFGLFDTPCHIAQMKSVERQNKILQTEKHLTRDSCLCDACYRHVDRKSNTPSYTNKSLKRNSLVAPGPRQNHCHVLGCNKLSANILRRKWIIKMRKSICQVINIDLDNPGLHSIPICDEHYNALEHLMVCAMCKRRLARNHIHYLGPETSDLNKALNEEGIPLTLTDKPVVCKLCKCFASVILKEPDERPENCYNFFVEYKRRLLHFNDIVPMDEAAAEEPIAVPSRDRDKSEKEQIKKKKKMGKGNSNGEQMNDLNQLPDGLEIEKLDQNNVPSCQDSNNQSRPESPMDYNSVDYNTLIPSINMECSSDTETKKEPPKKAIIIKKLPRLESVKEAVEISKNLKLKNDKSSDIAVQRLGSNPSISVRQLFPGEEDLPLSGNIDFHNVKERTPEGWEKCTSLIQYDLETKHLWHELQKPYGNQSSFLRHLILLEKYFRNGDLILSPNASHHSINYNESVHNRLRAYDNIPSNMTNIQPISMLQFNKAQKSSSGIITSTPISKEVMSMTSPPPVTLHQNSINSIPKSTPITLAQLNSPPLLPATTAALLPPSITAHKIKPVGAPPGLISLHPGTTRPIAPATLTKIPQSQKIKFPITKNWRPNLIPIDPNKKPTERKSGLVQVISGGKPYHITLEDYKKMCAIKRSFEMKQKKLQEAASVKPIIVTHNSVLKSIIPRKGLIISKTATVTSPKNEMPIQPSQNNYAGPESSSESETILEKLDKQVEKLESKLNEKPSSSLVLPKIPKSLTVIPQTVTRKASRPSSPVLLITPKNSSNKS